MGLLHSDAAPLAGVAAQVLQAQLRPGFLQPTVAHVEHGDLIPLSRRHAAVAGYGVVAAATVPLAGVDLKFPGKASIKDKGAGLVVFITPA